MEIVKSRIAIRYLILEMIPSFVLGVIIFLLILLMFQALRLTEWVLIHGVELSSISEMMFYLSISFLPIIFPMSLLFSILLTYGRLSQDAEITAFKSIGLSMNSLLAPALAFGLAVCLLSAHTSFELAPWGNRQFELLIHKLGSSKASVTINEGKFSEGFFNLVVYANEVDSKQGVLKNVFIYDERNENAPVTIIADKGQILQRDTQDAKIASLRLIDGAIHRTSGERHTKVEFSVYDIILNNPVERSVKEKSIQSLTLDEMRRLVKDESTETNKKWQIQTEFHKRWSLAVGCLLFAGLGVGLGTNTNRRAGTSNGFIMSLGVVVLYWILFAVGDSMNRSRILGAGHAIWIPSLLFLGLAIWSLKRVWR